MTLWELAQSWEHVWITEDGDYVHNETELGIGNLFDSNCKRCQLEQWAREKAKEYSRYLSSNYYNAADNFLAELGVPEDECSKRF